MLVAYLVKDIKCDSKKFQPSCAAPDVCMVDPKPKDCKSPEAGQPFSMYFKPECVYCGEPEKDKDGKEIPGKFKKGEWMTPDNCPVVFHCGNKSFDVNTPYAVYAKVTEKVNGVDKVKYVLSTTPVTETCDHLEDSLFCKEDCPPPKEQAPKKPAAAKPAKEKQVAKPLQTGLADCEKVDNARRQKAIAQVLNRATAIRGTLEETKPEFKGKDLGVKFTGTLGGQNGGDVDLTSITVEGVDAKKLMENKMKSAHVPNGIPCGFSYDKGKLKP